MRPGTRGIRSALIAGACVAVPAIAAPAASALGLPGVSVSVGTSTGSSGSGLNVPGLNVSAGVSVGNTNVGASVSTPSVSVPAAPSGSSGPVPETPTLPDPIGNAVDDVRDTANNAANTATGGNNQPAPSPGGGNNSSNNGSTGTSGGGGSPRANGGGSSGGANGGRNGTARGRSGGAGGRGEGARGARGGDGAGGGAAAGASKQGASGNATTAKAAGEEKSSSNPVAQILRDIERVIPLPIWIIIGVLGLMALGFGVRTRVLGARAGRLERQKEALLDDVGLLQRALLPDVPENLRGIDVSVAYRPAEGPAAGGDFYDVFELDSDRTAIIVGDVCGHGRQALAVTALMRYTLRAYLGAGFEPRLALQVAARTIEGDPDGELTTVVLAIYDARAGTLTYACAGHEPPIILGVAAHEPVTIGSSPPLGGFMDTGHRQTTVALPPGSSVCFFTDGLVEARLGDNMIGRGRLTELLSELGPEEGAQLLLQRLATQADRAPDDMAACLVRTKLEAVDARTIRIEEMEVDDDDLAGQRVREFLVACGLDSRKVEETLRATSAKVSEFGAAVLRVDAAGPGTRAEIVPVDLAAMPVPALVTDARRRAGMRIPV
jgi:hypothetical protein